MANSSEIFDFLLSDDFQMSESKHFLKNHIRGEVGGMGLRSESEHFSESEHISESEPISESDHFSERESNPFHKASSFIKRAAS